MTPGEIVELQASLMRRWVNATAEFRSGLCTSGEYEGYLKMLRGVAARVSAEECPHHGKSLTRRAHAYAAPIRLGVTGSGLGEGSAGSSGEVPRVMPRQPPPHEWRFTAGFGHTKFVPGGYYSKRQDARGTANMPGMNPLRLRR